MMNSLFADIRAANLNRKFENLPRRLIKLMEEMGELSEAYLNVTSDNNPKVKTYDDVCEEMVDVVIVALDIMLTTLPSESDDDVINNRLKMFEQKLLKWKNGASTVFTNTKE